MVFDEQVHVWDVGYWVGEDFEVDHEATPWRQTGDGGAGVRPGDGGGVERPKVRLPAVFPGEGEPGAGVLRMEHCMFPGEAGCKPVTVRNDGVLVICARCETAAGQ